MGRRGGGGKVRGKRRGGCKAAARMMTDIEADMQVAFALAGDVAKGENCGSRGGRFLHDNHPEWTRDQEGAIRGKDDSMTRGRSARRKVTRQTAKADESESQPHQR